MKRRRIVRRSDFRGVKRPWHVLGRPLSDNQCWRRTLCCLHNYWLLLIIATYVYIVHIHMHLYTYVYGLYIHIQQLLIGADSCEDNCVCVANNNCSICIYSPYTNVHVLLRLHNYWPLLIIPTNVYIVHIHMFIYANVFIVQKWTSTPIPLPCHAQRWA